MNIKNTENALDNVLLPTPRCMIQTLSAALHTAAQHISNEVIMSVARLLTASPGVIVCLGLGKSGHIARKFATTLASLGLRAYFMHAHEALHGDSGAIKDQDICVLFSVSGSIHPALRERLQHQKNIVAFTLMSQSPLAQMSHMVVGVERCQELCPANFAPTTSTLVLLALADVVAMQIAYMRQMTAADYKIHHPEGALGGRTYHNR